MDSRLNQIVERINDFLAHKPGVLPLFGIGLIIINFLLQIFLGPEAWVAQSNLFLHIGLVTSLIGLLLVNVYRH